MSDYYRQNRGQCIGSYVSAVTLDPLFALRCCATYNAKSQTFVSEATIFSCYIYIIIINRVYTYQLENST